MSMGIRKSPIMVNILNLTKSITSIIAHYTSVIAQNTYFSPIIIAINNKKRESMDAETAKQVQDK